MTGKQGIFKKKKLLLRYALVAFVLFGLACFVSIFLFFSGKIIPGIYLGGIYVGSLTKETAQEKLKTNILIPDNITLVYRNEMDPQVFKIPTNYIEVEYNYAESINKAFKIGRDEKPLINVSDIANTLIYEQHLPLIVTINSAKLKEHIQVISGQSSTDAVYPSVKLNGNTIIVEKGKPGVELDTNYFEDELKIRLANLNFSPIELKTRLVNPTLSDAEANELYKRAESMLTKELKLEHNDKVINITGQNLISFMAYKGGYDTTAISKKVEEIAKEVETLPQNPTLVFADGKAQEFAPGTNGVELKKAETTDAIVRALRELEITNVDEISIKLFVTETPPPISIGEINNLGIKELIGKGTSKFKGSIASRIHNVALASSKINGILIAPGEEFSFNKALGDISKFTGYKEAYIIQDGKTVLGDGGGVCQVSTTLFRAALNAGLPITERRGHSYRVGYYEQDSPPGIDATVFSPTTDFKFTNDTGSHILIQATADTKNLSLVFELYGTSDGRVATITKPVITSSIAPPEDLYVDDPNLPSGTIKQIEYKAWGAKVSFNYEVSRNGESLYTKTFLTNYKPWQAVYLRGTKPL